MGLGADELHFVSPLGGDGQRERQRVADLAAGPPEVVIAAPAAGLEGRHLLAAGLAAGDGQNLEAFAFDGAFQTPDAGGGGREAVGELQVGHQVDHLFLRKRIQQAFRHERHRQDLAFFDLSLGDRELRAARHGQTERLRILELDDAAHGGAALQLEDVELVVLADDAVGIEHVLEEVIEFADVGAGEARADLVADVAEGMADAAGRREELAAGRDVALAHGLGLEQGLVLGLVLGEVGLRRVDHADDRGELRVEFLVAERLQLPHHERREQSLVGLARGHGGQERLAADGVARKRGDGVGQLLGRKDAESTQQHGRRIVVADGGEGLDQRAPEGRRGLLGEDLMDHRRGRAIARGDEHGEGALPGRQRRLCVREMSAIESTAGFVAGEGVEFVEVGQEIGRGALTEAGDERGPARGRRERSGLADPFDDASDERRAARCIRLTQGERQHLGAGAGVAGEAAIDEVGGLRMTADGGEGEATGGVGADQRFDAIPEEERNIMVLGVFLAGQQRLGDRGALGERQIAEGGSEFAADLRGGLGLGQFGQGRHAGGPLLRDEADGPTADGGVGVLEGAGEERVVEQGRRLQRPEGPEAAERIGGTGQRVAQLRAGGCGHGRLA